MDTHILAATLGGLTVLVATVLIHLLLFQLQADREKHLRVMFAKQNAYRALCSIYNRMIVNKHFRLDDSRYVLSFATEEDALAQLAELERCIGEALLYASKTLRADLDEILYYAEGFRGLAAGERRAQLDGIEVSAMAHRDYTVAIVRKIKGHWENAYHLMRSEIGVE